MLNQFKNLSCYEEFEIWCTLTGISKIDVLKELGQRIDNYYFFVSKDGIFNWFDLVGNHVKDPGVLKELEKDHIPLYITKCIIPNSVTHISYDAFSYCESLKEITIPDSVKHISKYAFFDCKSLKEIIIPNSVISIGDYAFCYCISLKSITILNNVTGIGKGIFEYCSSLKEVIFKGKTLKEVEQMYNYPFEIIDERIIKCEL